MPTPSDSRTGRLSMPLAARYLDARYADELSSGNFRFEFTGSMRGVKKVIVPRRNKPADLVLVRGDTLELFLLNITDAGTAIAGLWPRDANPWLTGRGLPRAGDIVKGRVAELIRGAAFIELDEPGPPFTLHAFVGFDDLPAEAHGRTDPRQLDVGDRLIGFAKTINPADLGITVDCREYQTWERRESGRRNIAEHFRTRAGTRQPTGSTGSMPPPTSQLERLHGKKVIVFDDESDLAEITCTWLRHNGAGAWSEHRTDKLARLIERETPNSCSRRLQRCRS